jgi:hypothetical protein
MEEFIDANLRGARFVRSDLSGAVMRAVDVQGMDIDAPWLLDGESTLLVNSVDVAPLVEAELNRRFPGRSLRRASDPAGLREAWSMLEQAWAAAVDRALSMPDGTVDVSVAGEWSFAQTLRHLVMATDVWLRRAVLGVAEPFHPLGMPHVEYETDGYDMSVFASGIPTFEEVLVARRDRAGMVSDFLAAVTVEDLTVPRSNPWDPAHSETTLSCVQVIFEEEWEHLRFALRDLDAIGSGDS